MCFVPRGLAAPRSPRRRSITALRVWGYVLRGARTPAFPPVGSDSASTRTPLQRLPSYSPSRSEHTRAECVIRSDCLWNARVSFPGPVAGIQPHTWNGASGISHSANEAGIVCLHCRREVLGAPFSPSCARGCGSLLGGPLLCRVTKDGLTLRRATLLGPEVVPGAPQPKGAAEL